MCLVFSRILLGGYSRGHKRIQYRATKQTSRLCGPPGFVLMTFCSTAQKQPRATCKCISTAVFQYTSICKGWHPGQAHRPQFADSLLVCILETQSFYWLQKTLEPSRKVKCMRQCRSQKGTRFSDGFWKSLQQSTERHWELLCRNRKSFSWGGGSPGKNTGYTRSWVQSLSIQVKSQAGPCEIPAHHWGLLARWSNRRTLNSGFSDTRCPERIRWKMIYQDIWLLSLASAQGSQACTLAHTHRYITHTCTREFEEWTESHVS